MTQWQAWIFPWDLFKEYTSLRVFLCHHTDSIHAINYQHVCIFNPVFITTDCSFRWIFLKGTDQMMATEGERSTGPYKFVLIKPQQHPL